MRRLKIDKGFVQDLPHSGDALGIVQAVLALAETLQLDVVAEGVEREDQRDLLMAEGVRVGQGFLWHHPRPPNDLPPA